MKYKSTLFAGFALALTTGCGQAEQTPQSATAQSSNPVQTAEPDVSVLEDVELVQVAEPATTPPSLSNMEHHGQFDILGLRLGMSPAEVEAIFQAEAAKDNSGKYVHYQTTEVVPPGVSNVSHLFGHLLTIGTDRDPEYVMLRSIIDRDPGSEEAIGFYRRYSVKWEDAPSLERYEQAIFDKYGQPTKQGEMGRNNYYAWAEDGQPEECLNILRLTPPGSLETMWANYSLGYAVQGAPDLNNLCGEMFIIYVAKANANGSTRATKFEQFLINPQRHTESNTAYNEHWERVVRDRQTEAAESNEVPL